MIEYPRYLLNQIKHQPKLIYHSTFSHQYPPPPPPPQQQQSPSIAIIPPNPYPPSNIQQLPFPQNSTTHRVTGSISNTPNNNNNNNNNINNGNSPTIKLPPIVNYPSKSLPSPCYQNLIHQYHHHKHLIHRVLNLNCLIYPGY